MVEDDPSLGFVIQDNLNLKGFEVTLCTDGEQAERTFFENEFHLCILDVMLPLQDGFTLARKIRARHNSIPILFLTAKGMEEDRLEGFKAGGDDYITKPFSLNELFMRMEVFQRRSEVRKNTNDLYQIGQFIFNPVNFKLTSAKDEIVLTRKEADVLKYLYSNRNKVIKREDILKELWGDDDYFLGRSLDVFISKLRKYLKGDPAVQIVNYHGIGFRLEF